MEYSELIQKRYSCKKYDGRPAEADKLQAVLEAGRLAPTAKNLQEQHIYVVYTYPGGGRTSGVEDATIVATHMILAAANAGLDSCWINNFDPDALAADLGLPEDEEILMLMDLGYAAPGFEPLPNHSRRKDLSETVSYL